MAIFQPGGGYRDPSKALSIKALQERQKLAADRLANANQTAEPMISPWQGAAQLGGVLSGIVGQRKADAAEGDARMRLSEIMAGIDPEKGATQQQYAEMRVLDPEMADRQYEAAMQERWKVANREDTQTFEAGESKAERDARVAAQQAGFTHDDTSAATLVKTNEAAAISENERGDQDRVDEANIAANKARLDAALSSDYAKIDAEVAAGTTSAADAAVRKKQMFDAANAEIESSLKGTEHGPIKTGADLGMTGEEATKSFQQDVNTKEWKPVVSGGGTQITTNLPGGGDKLDERLDINEGDTWTGFQNSRNVAGASQNDFRMMGELIKMAPQGPIMGTLASLPILKNFSNAGVAFNSIVKRIAPTMRVAGSGSTSDLEYQGMLDSLSALQNYPEANSLILGMMQAKAALDMERGNIVDQYRNGAFSPDPQQNKILARQKLSEISNRNIEPPELKALREKAVGEYGVDTSYRDNENPGGTGTTDGFVIEDD